MLQPRRMKAHDVTARAPARVDAASTAAVCVPALSAELQKICRWQNLHLPVAKFYFAVYPVRILPSASETLAIGKLFICRRQTKNLQSASAPLAIGKMYV